MDWYYVVAVIAAFVAVVGVLIYLGKKGYVSSELMRTIKTLVSGMSDLLDIFAKKNNQNQLVTVLDKATDLLEMAVLAAENMYYNGEITADQRYEVCVDIFTELLASYQIQVPDSFVLTMRSLIAAMCETMGHMRATKAELEALEGGE